MKGRIREISHQGLELFCAPSAIGAFWGLSLPIHNMSFSSSTSQERRSVVQYKAQDQRLNFESIWC